MTSTAMDVETVTKASGMTSTAMDVETGSTTVYISFSIYYMLYTNLFIFQQHSSVTETVSNDPITSFTATPITLDATEPPVTALDIDDTIMVNI
jgi:hypothetical protein